MVLIDRSDAAVGLHDHQFGDRTEVAGPGDAAARGDRMQVAETVVGDPAHVTVTEGIDLRVGPVVHGPDGCTVSDVVVALDGRIEIRTLPVGKGHRRQQGRRNAVPAPQVPDGSDIVTLCPDHQVTVHLEGLDGPTVVVTGQLVDRPAAADLVRRNVNKLAERPRRNGRQHYGHDHGRNGREDDIPFHIRLPD